MHREILTKVGILGCILFLLKLEVLKDINLKLDPSSLLKFPELSPRVETDDTEQIED